MPTITENEDGKGSYGARLVRLDKEWAYDLWSYPGGVEKYSKYAIAPWRCSWYHRCLNSNMYLRCDYIKNINKYYPDPRNGAAQISYSTRLKNHSTVKEPLCVHCYKSMPSKYARMFQLLFLDARLHRNREDDEFKEATIRVLYRGYR